MYIPFRSTGFDFVHAILSRPAARRPRRAAKNAPPSIIRYLPVKKTQQAGKPPAPKAGRLHSRPLAAPGRPSATLRLRGPIGSRDAQGSGIMWSEISAWLRKHSSEKSLQIDIIDSPGGDVFSAERAYAAIRRAADSGQHITTRAVGAVSSAAVDIFLAGDLRIASPRARFFLHNTSADATAPVRWTAEKHHRQAKRLAAHDDSFLDRLVNQTGAPREDWLEIIEAEATLTPAQAQVFGLVHEVK